MKCDEQKTECATHTPHHPAMAKFPDDLSGCGETPPCGDASWMHPHHTPPVGERGLGEGGGSHPSSPPPCEGGAGTFWGTRVAVKLCNAENGSNRLGKLGSPVSPPTGHLTHHHQSVTAPVMAHGYLRRSLWFGTSATVASVMPRHML